MPNITETYLGFRTIEGSNHRFVGRLEQTNFGAEVNGEALPEAFEIQIDAVLEEDLNQLNQGDFELSRALELRTAIIEFTVSLGQFEEYFGRATDELIHERWFSFEVNNNASDESIPVLRYASLTDPNPIHEYISMASIRMLGKDENKIRPLSGCLFQLPAEGNNFHTLAVSTPIDRVEIVDVGQGNMNLLHAQSGNEIIAFDFGGGVLQNHKTWPKKPDLPDITKIKAVVLSHWDFDHWGAINRLNQPEIDHITKNVDWFVPRQTLGTNHAKFAAVLHRHGRLHIFPHKWAYYPYRYWPNFSVFKCTGAASDRNNSGLAVLVRNSEYRTILLPADAGYDYIGHRKNYAYVGIVVSHHGGHSTGLPPPANTPAVAAYSYGKGNSFGHPISWKVGDHAAAGWRQHPSTASQGAGKKRGNIVLRFQ